MRVLILAALPCDGYNGAMEVVREASNSIVYMSTTPERLTRASVDKRSSSRPREPQCRSTNHSGVPGRKKCVQILKKPALGEAKTLSRC